MVQCISDYDVLVTLVLSTLFQHILSYNVEQSRGEMHNIVAVLMTYKGLDRQSVMDL